EYRLALNQQIPPYPCDVVEEVVRAKGVVPHELPGTNKFIGDFGKKYNLPLEATEGGAPTMYPDEAIKLVTERNAKYLKK
ncbi:MAG: hypothetical protein JOZ22_13525, partial [Acidobacteriia bacterium]|nr:hypothetical protein [Terriglobia bacterium]